MNGDLPLFNLPEIERDVLKFWKEKKVFKEGLKRSLKKAKKNFVFFEGPPTANGHPGLHHVLARVYKDVILRYRTMKGEYVLRRAGWDTQGLPVEIQVEKELGLKDKNDIETYGVAAFNQKAKDSVWQFKGEWENLTERIGYWLDFENDYVTYRNDYLESIWWILGQAHEKKLIKKSYRIAPWCTRCGTTLSSHEMGQPGVYKLKRDPSLYVKFKILSKGEEDLPAGRQVPELPGNDSASEFLLVWTTTPWTLPANMAVAVNPKLQYKKFKVKKVEIGVEIDSKIEEDLPAGRQVPELRGNDPASHKATQGAADGGQNKTYEYLWSAMTLPNGIIGEVVEEKLGKELLGWKYEPLYKDRASYKVYSAGFISDSDGTGLVHVAPAFGEEDFNLLKDDLGEGEILMTVDDRGAVVADVPGKGRYVKQADKEILEDLNQRDLVFYQTEIEHEYPHCWRCGSLILYMARTSWFILMSKLRKELVAENKKINWVPEYVKEGRFGNWIAEAKDWAISRNRYWGTPLPIWECSNLKCKDFTVVESLEDLNKKAFHKNEFWVMRHGEADHILKHFLAGDLGNDWSNLTERGRKQIESKIEKLKKIGITKIYSSPFKRTMQTAGIIAEALGLEILVDDRLKETASGVFDGGDYKKRKEFLLSFGGDMMAAKPQGGESFYDVRGRVINGFKEINEENRGQKILVVSHGDPIWMISSGIKAISNEEMLVSKHLPHGKDLEVGEFKELKFNNWPFNDKGELDLHKPFVDNLCIKCGKCGDKMWRIPEVCDVWLDSGAMPYAAWHYPFENKAVIDKKTQFPADYICEAMDQTRGWYYTLLALGVILGKGRPFNNVVTLGHILDKSGQKMSKSKGNVVEPFGVCDKDGADALRWYLFTLNQPGDTKRFDESDLVKSNRRFLALIYNSFSFLKTYGDLKIDFKLKPKHIMDRWILARLNEVIFVSQNYLESYKIVEAALELEKFVDDLSRWYIRSSRKRADAWPVLGLVLFELNKLIAPFTPFFSEMIYQVLRQKNKKLELSVHWERASEPNKKLVDKKLLKEMEEVRRLASLALALRAESGIKVKQPLSELKIKTKISLSKEILVVLANEVNVKRVIIDKKIKEDVVLDLNITEELRLEGITRELLRAVAELRQEANLKPKDKIILVIEAWPEFEKIILANKDFEKAVNAKLLIQKVEKVKLEGRLDFGVDQKIIFGIKDAPHGKIL